VYLLRVGCRYATCRSRFAQPDSPPSEESSKRCARVGLAVARVRRASRSALAGNLAHQHHRIRTGRGTVGSPSGAGRWPPRPGRAPVNPNRINELLILGGALRRLKVFVKEGAHRLQIDVNDASTRAAAAQPPATFERRKIATAKTAGRGHTISVLRVRLFICTLARADNPEPVFSITIRSLFEDSEGVHFAELATRPCCRNRRRDPYSPCQVLPRVTCRPRCDLLVEIRRVPGTRRT